MNTEEIDALKPSNKLDKLIATEVMSWEFVDVTPHAEHRTVGESLGYWYRGADGILRVVSSFRTDEISFSPSTDIAAAWEVVERFKNNITLSFDLGKWAVHVFDGDDNVIGESEADTAPLAICRAAFKAVVK